jgi:hypothetical protein
MRILIAWLIVGASFAAPAFAQADDDPKAARGETFDLDADHAVVHDDDDPKTSRAPALYRRRSWDIRHYVPRAKLAYRNFSTIGLQKGDTLGFHVAELDFYPSSGYLRFGLECQLGFAPGKYDAWFLATGAALGFQYPGRVTPFLEGRFDAGLLGGSAAGATAVSYIYMGGIDTGIELYVTGRFYVTAAIGWVHPVYSGVDIDWVLAHPGMAPARKDFESDSFTFKVGIGL